MTVPRDSSEARALPPVEATLAADPPAAVEHHAATYRPDVDGLRAIAVSLTVLFHLHVEGLLDGGFIGVDVFFVISGYLITGLLLRELRRDAFSLGRFYERRVRRIVPALATLIGLALVAGYVLMLPGHYAQLARSALWALGAASNVFFLDNTGYFDAEATSLPLLHTWSLGVEEQFYFVWPLLLLVLFKLCRGRDRNLGLCLGIVVLVSFVLNVREVQTEPKAAFFLLKTRAWELGAGGLLTLWPALGASRARRALAEMLPVLGLTLIGWGAATLSSELAYPGYHALLPVIGAMLVVYESGHRTLVRRVLGTAPLVFLGKISYSLYLVSWPLTVYWRTYANGTALGATAAGVLVVVSVLLAAASWRWIEQPARRATLPRRTVFARAAIAGLVLAIAARAVIATDGAMSRIPEKARNLGDIKVMWQWDCPENLVLGLPTETIGPASKTTCVVGAPWESARTRAIVWGDSFAEHIMPLLDAAGREVGTSVALVPQCPPIFDDVNLQRYWPQLPGYNASCAQQRAATIRYLAEHDDVRVVLIASAWATLVGMLQQNGGPVIPRDKGGPPMAEALDRLIPEIAAPGRRIVLFGDTPRLPVPDPSACAVAKVSPLLRDCPPDLGVVAWNNVTGAIAPVHDVMAGVAQRHPETVLYRPQDHLCRENRCDVEIDGEFLYRDGGHLRRNLTPEVDRKLAAKMGLADLLKERAPPVLAAESFIDDRFQVAAGESLQADRMVSVAGHGYFGMLSGKIPGLREGGDGRTLRLVEDGVPLGPTGALSADVVQRGLGRFNHETATRILFSTSDNSDPRSNGREYRVEWDEPARIVPRSAERIVGIGTTEVVVDVAPRRPITSRRLLVENLDPTRALRVWGHAKDGPDLSTGDALIASVVRPGMSAEEKALALWGAIVTWRHHDVAAAASPEASDPVKLLGVYGFGFCNDSSHALAGLLERAGLPARVAAWNQHSVVEVQFEGEWHLLDPDLERVYRTESQQLASVADVFTRRVTAAFSPTGAVPLSEASLDLIYPRGTELVHHRPTPPSEHALRPVLEPGDAVVFDFDRGDLMVDRFSYARPRGWPLRFANGTLRRLVSARSDPGCRSARVAWPYPIVGVEISAHGLRLDGPLVVQVRGDATEPWQDLRVERIATDAKANASVWIERGPLRYGLEARVCSTGSTGLDARAELLLEATFQFAPRAIPSIGYGANSSVWTVENATDTEVDGPSPGVRITQVWDELDTPDELVAPTDAVVVNLDRSFFSRLAGFAYTTPLSQQLRAGAGSLDPRSDALRVTLFENGRPLGPGNAVEDVVADLGRGRFVLRHGNLLFTASDNTDPRQNDRIYTIVLAPGDGESAMPTGAARRATTARSPLGN